MIVFASASIVMRSPFFTSAIGPPHLGFGRHVADDEAGRAAGEAAVGDERDVRRQPGADDRAGRRKHFRHAGPALRAFVADNDDVALLDLLLLHRGQHLFFRVEAVGGAGETAGLPCR